MDVQIVSAEGHYEENELNDGMDNLEMNQSFTDGQEERFLAPEDLSDIEEEHFSTKKIYCIQCQRRLCSWILYVWIGIFVIGCFTAVVVVSVLVVGPYRAAAKFQFTNCKPYGFQRKGLEEQCSCGKGCTSAFPCIKVLITFKEYSSLTSHNASENIVLHETETTLYRENGFIPGRPSKCNCPLAKCA